MIVLPILVCLNNLALLLVLTAILVIICGIIAKRDDIINFGMCMGMLGGIIIAIVLGIAFFVSTFCGGL